MQHRWNRALGLFLFLVLAINLTACSPSAGGSSESVKGGGPAPAQAPAPGGGGITVQDAQGTLELPKKPERIVAMEFSFTDMLVTLGVVPVGVADDGSPELFMDSVKSRLATYTSVGSRYEPNIELISSLKPDLIIVDINKHKNALKPLKAIAPVLVLDDFQADYDQMLRNYGIVAKAVGKEEEAKKRLAEHETIMNEAKQKISKTKLTVLPAVVNPKGFYAHSDHSYSGSLLAKLGFTDPVKHETAYPQLTLEQLVETNPQVLFLMPTEKETIVNQWQSNPLWNKIDAVAAKKVFTVERRDWSLSRGLLGSEKMAADIVKVLGE
ncbi:ABC transporter substrate-binding protein [Paenibacillus flagellatus]|uniref:ABC transporter substrate-binding protein n=1 Tax=Paenibacillus flagellatus TaxID=2211139 RepID=A0A2V5KXU4_9BACL|nr:Fe(3+) dicitrate ABC transporter substrate-binding protein [Paenibacillus flagellatus]PYI57347.1 ABC transporter substrate-binding protein [Paenibacillus flagellatus]